MTSPLRALATRWQAAALAWIGQCARSRRCRHAAAWLAGVLALVGILGFLVAPPILRSQLQTRLSTLLDRPTTIGAVHVNPYTLRVELDQLQIADRGGRAPFVAVDQVVVNASWTSLFRLAPILDEVKLQGPRIHLTRSAPQVFNFSDLVAKFTRAPSPPDAKPARFAVSNIQIANGDITFVDAVTHATHRVTQLQLGIPFLANLPRDTNVFVQPLLAMRVDGSLIRITGQTKPFADSRESVVQFTLDHLDLPKYMSYVPAALPVAIPRGQLSGEIRLHFAQAPAGPQVRIGGTVRLDGFAVTTATGLPLVEAGHAQATLADVEPLLSRYRFGAVALDGLVMHVMQGRDGRINLAALTAPAPPAPAAKPAVPTDLRIATLALTNGQFVYADEAGKVPATLRLTGIHGTLGGLSTLAAPPAAVDVAASLNGGSLEAKGQLDLAASSWTGTLAASGIGLAPLQALAPPVLTAQLESGTLSAGGQWRATWGNAFNLALTSGTLGLRNVALRQHGRTPVAVESLDADIPRFELAKRQVELSRITVRGLRLDAQRQANGAIDLAQLVHQGTPASRTDAAPPWHWSIGALTVADSALAFSDPAVKGRGGKVDFTLRQAQVQGLSDDLRKAVKLALDGGTGRGTLQVDGHVRLQPLDAELRVRSSRVNVAALQSLITVPLNVTLASAQVSADGTLRYQAAEPSARIDWRGRVTLGNVRVRDKLTGDDFLRWNSLVADGMNVRLGEDMPHVAVRGLALDDFYARLIINADGHANLRDVVANPQASPVSVTQAAPTATASKPKAPAIGTPPAAARAPAADIEIGQITLANGHLNYTDNFIKPNYTADITALSGSVGRFGTAGGAPAPVSLQGQLDSNAPVTITGTIDPLAPVAALDITGKASGVELTHMSPYAGKYTGYPITKGRLTADVHYQLANGRLTADNHLFIDQLTFGDRIEGPGISHLPVKLAVALLKNTQGQIDVHVPVSGSLDDPHFSVGGLVWQAFVHLIGRAVTSPFRLIAAALGGGDQDLGQVPFAPGSAVLDTAAQQQLAQVVTVLEKKPSLKLNITGRAAPEQDAAGLRTVTVDDLVQQEAGSDAGKLSAEQFDKYLKKAYRHASFTKPRDAIGLTKSQPPDVMRRLLEANVPTDADAMRHLAERRADAVRAWLRGKVDDNRVFVLAPVVDDGKAAADSHGPATRVDLGLQP